MKTVTIHYAKTHLSRLLQEVSGGQEILVAKGNKPIARIVPLQKMRRVPPQDWSRAVIDDTGILSPLPEAEIQAWNGTCAPASDPLSL